MYQLKNMSLLVVPKTRQELSSTSCPDCKNKIANGNDDHNLFVQEKGKTPKKTACDAPVEDGSSQNRVQKHHLVNVVRAYHHEFTV